MLKHNIISSYPKEYFDLYSEFKNGGTIREWGNYVERELSKFTDDDVKNKFRGDMLEVLAEIFFNVFHADEGIGIKDYTPIEITEDYGVDATGINVNGHNIAMQVKYRANPFDLITYADMARTYTSALCQLQMKDVYLHDHTLYLFTISNGVTGACEKVLGRKLIIINRGIISTKIDNNVNFWSESYNMIFEKLS